MLCRNLFAARSLASSNAAAAVAGLFAVVVVADVDGASETCELVVISSKVLKSLRRVVASATPSGMIGSFDAGRGRCGGH